MSRLPYQLAPSDLYREFETSDFGLAQTVASDRLLKNGFNALPAKKADSYFLIFSRQFKSPLIYILLLAGVVVFWLGEYGDAVIILAVLIFNALIGALQEGKAQNALQALTKLVTTQAVVLREGGEKIINSTEVVVGDVILLEAGDKIPADARLLEVNDLKIDESSLTGESETVIKAIEILTKADLSVSDQRNMVFSGSYVISGKGRAMVVATGLKTVIGQISNRMKLIDNEMPLTAELASLSRVVLVGVLIINIFLFTIGLFLGRGFFEMFQTVVAVSVSAIPEGLPVVVTIVLATGVWRMSKQNALVKRLQAVEALGQAKVIAVDKTGTITKNELMIETVYLNNQEYEVTGNGYEPVGFIKESGKIIEHLSHADLLLAGKIATFCANARVAFSEDKKTWQVSGDPTEAALLVFGQKLGFHQELVINESPQIGELPFNTKSKYHVTLHQTSEGKFLTQVGAPETVMERVTHILVNGVKREITEADRENFRHKIHDLANRGLRILAFAIEADFKNDLTEENVLGTTLIGLFGLRDSIRLEARESILLAKSAGIQVVMITGDHASTARAIARLVGIFTDGDLVVTGEELVSMSDEVLLAKLNQVSVFARVTPEHKLRIIDLYKKRGDIVAMTGDGVNDALSLVSADLGVAMGKIGTEVAKEAADIILLDDNFKSIVSAIEEGRNIFKTIKKVILYLFSTSIAEVLIIMIAIFLGWPLPILASQIIWLNLVTDGFLVAALALDPKESNLLREPFRKPNRWFFDREMLGRSLLMAGVMTIGTLVVFWFYSFSGDLVNITRASSVTLTLLVLYQWMNIWNCRSEKRSIFTMEIRENYYLVLASILVFMLQLGALYLPILQKLLHTTPLNIFDWSLVLLISTTVIMADEVQKLVKNYFSFPKKLA